MLFGQQEEQQIAADSSRKHTRLGQPSHPQLKLSSVLRLLLIMCRRRSNRVWLVFSCVWFSSELGCSENADSTSWESAVCALCYGTAFVSPPTTMAVRGRVLALVSRFIAPAFSFNRLSPSRPPHHTGSQWERFDGGLPYHSSCVFLQLLFFAFFLAP